VPPFIGTSTPDLPSLSNAYISHFNNVANDVFRHAFVLVAHPEYPSFKVSRALAEALSKGLRAYSVVPMPPCLGISFIRRTENNGTHQAMKERILTLANNPLLQMMMAGVFAYTAFVAVILATLQMPPEALLDSGLQEVLLVFEE
jgi:hypothetical protein